MRITTSFLVPVGEPEKDAAARAVREHFGDAASVAEIVWSDFERRARPGFVEFELDVEISEDKVEEILEASPRVPAGAKRITRDVTVLRAETKHEAATRWVKEEFGEDSSAAIAIWENVGVQFAWGVGYNNVKLVVVREDATKS